MTPGPYTWVLLASTFLLSALWAAVLLLLVRIRESEGDGARGHVGVELAWAVIPALLVLSLVVPTLQAVQADAGSAADESARVVEVPPVYAPGTPPTP